MAKTLFGVTLAVAALLGTACTPSPLAPNPGAASGIGAGGGSGAGTGIRAYEAIDLGTRGGERTLPSAVNDNGLIVGASQAADRRTLGFAYHDDVMWALRASQAVYDESADAVNVNGQIGGVGRVARAVLRWNNGLQDAPDLQVFPTPTSSPPPSRVVAFNAAGDMLVGLDDYVHSARGVVLRDGVFEDVGGLTTHVWTYPLAWNERGQVVGTSFVRHVAPTYDIFRPFIWEAGVMKDLGVLGDLACGDTQEDCAGGQAVDINAQGTVVGTVTGPAGLDRAFIWQDGVMHDLGAFEGHSTWAIAINDRSQVLFAVGVPELGVFVWDQGAVQRVGSVGVQIWGRALGDSGQVVGEMQIADGSVHAFVWNAGTLTDLGPDGATAINARGDIIGTDGLRGILW